MLCLVVIVVAVVVLIILILSLVKTFIILKNNNANISCENYWYFLLVSVTAIMVVTMLVFLQLYSNHFFLTTAITMGGLSSTGFEVGEYSVYSQYCKWTSTYILPRIVVGQRYTTQITLINEASKTSSWKKKFKATFAEGWPSNTASLLATSPSGLGTGVELYRDLKNVLTPIHFPSFVDHFWPPKFSDPHFNPRIFF